MLEFTMELDGQVSSLAGIFHVSVTYQPNDGDPVVLSMMATRKIPSSLFPSTFSETETQDLKLCANAPESKQRLCLLEA